MQWKISNHRVALTERDTFTIALYATDRPVADVVFVERPDRRFWVAPETRFVTIRLSPSEPAGLLDLLRHERGLTLDVEGLALRFER